MHGRKLVIELKPPLNPENIRQLFDKVEGLITSTKQVNIASKPFGQSISGFDLSYNLARYLLDKVPQLDILYHVTCYDLNKVNIRSRLTLLRNVGIKRLLVISGDDYELAEDPKLRALQYEGSHELVQHIVTDFNWFDCIAVAGYPAGNGKSTSSNEEEVQRLSNVLRLGVNEIYTQCVFDIGNFFQFDKLIRLNFPQVRVIPSIALFENSFDLRRISLLTRVNGTRLHSLIDQLERMNPEESRNFALDWLTSTYNQLLAHTELIALCTFGRFELTKTLMVKELDIERSDFAAGRRR